MGSRLRGNDGVGTQAKPPLDSRPVSSTGQALRGNHHGLSEGHMRGRKRAPYRFNVDWNPRRGDGIPAFAGMTVLGGGRLFPWQ